MSYRKTSINTYHRIVADGLLSKKRLQVYNIIYNKGPINCRGIIKVAANGCVTNTGAISGRLSELEERGVIYVAFEDICPDTGNNTMFYATTDNLPTDPPPRVTNKQIIAKLEKENAALKKQLAQYDN